MVLMNQYKLFMFYDIVKSFCHFNANLLINIINHDDTINTIISEAKTTCTGSLEPYNNVFTFQVMKYSWPTINTNYPLESIVTIFTQSSGNVFQ
jgi:hypothetical protein